MNLFEVNEKNRFPTLSKLLAHLITVYPYGSFDAIGRDDTGQEFNFELPRWLYRGEERLWGTTYPSRDFLSTDTRISDIDKDIFRAVSDFACQRISSDFGLHPDAALAYAQHYGLYSDLLDFSGSLSVASRFASPKTSIGLPGRICVMNVAKALQNSDIFDLTRHQIATRARNQDAYGIRLKSDQKDVKQPENINRLGLAWYEFDVNDLAETLGAEDPYETEKDKLAGYLVLLVDEYFESKEKLSLASAEILSQRVPRYPFFAVTRDLHKIDHKKLGQNLPASETGLDKCDFEVKTADELGCNVDLKKENDNSVMLWSNGSKDPLQPIPYNIDSTLFAIRIIRAMALTNISYEG